MDTVYKFEQIDTGETGGESEGAQDSQMGIVTPREGRGLGRIATTEGAQNWVNKVPEQRVRDAD